MTDPILVGHHADNTLWCSCCGHLGTSPRPCDRTPERDHLNTHQETTI